MACTGSCAAAAAALAAPQSAWAEAWGVLSGAIGVYGYIKQHELQNRMVKLSERAADRADEYLAMTKDSYYNIAVPTHNRMRDLYDRYTGFWSRENDFINCAFALKEYCPDYDLAEGRAMARVRRIFGQARQAQSRNVGKFNTGRACHDATSWALQQAMAGTLAAGEAYRHEDRRKFEYDRWYWDRWKAGWNAISHMGDRGANAINKGAQTISASLDDVGRGVQAFGNAARQQAEAIGNQAAFWGNIGQGGMQAFGQALGNGYFDRGSNMGNYYAEGGFANNMSSNFLSSVASPLDVFTGTK